MLSRRDQLGIARWGRFSAPASFGDGPSSGSGDGPQLAPWDPKLEKGLFIDLVGDWVDGAVHAESVEIRREPLDFESIDAPVESLDSEPLRLTVLGQAVGLTDSTKIRDEMRDPLTFEEIRPGQQAKVKGTRAGNGTFYARRIRVRESDASLGGSVRLRGWIESRDESDRSLVLVGTTVRFGPELNETGS